MTLKLSNSSKNHYTVPVTEKSPAGAKLKTPFQDASVSGETQTLNVELPAGESKTLTCEYLVTAARGEEIVFTGGSVGKIPSNTIPVAVGGSGLTEEEQARLASIAEGAYREALADATDETLGQLVYARVLGFKITLPRFDAVPKTLLEENRFGYKALVFKKGFGAEERKLLQTLVPRFWGGMNLWIPRGGDCARDPRYGYLEPGDVVVRIPDATEPLSCRTLVYLGNRRFLQTGENGLEITDHKELERSLTYGLYYALRPTLAFDDIHTLS
jgi:hypothetical protein